MTFIEEGLRLTNTAIEMYKKYTHDVAVESVIINDEILENVFEHLKNNKGFNKDYPDLDYFNFRDAYFDAKIWLEVMKIVSNTDCPIKNKDIIVAEYIGSDDYTAHTFFKMIANFEGSSKDMNEASFEINSSILLNEAFPEYHL